jgi:type I restriction enzyme S subunit
MTQSNYLNFRIPFMNVEEQRQIVDFLDQKCAEIDQTISEKQQQFETLVEYKKSLIYEYITGKKEVA